MELRCFPRSGNKTSMQPTRCRRKKGANFGRKAREKIQIKTDQFRIAKCSHQQFRFYFKSFELLPSSRLLRADPTCSPLLFREFFSRTATPREITKQKSCKAKYCVREEKIFRGKSVHKIPFDREQNGIHDFNFDSTVTAPRSTRTYSNISAAPETKCE